MSARRGIRARITSVAQNLTLVLVSLACGLLLGEGLVRWLHLVPVNDYRRIMERGVSWRMRPHASMTEDQPEFKTVIRTNGAGFRDREFTRTRRPGRTRIALIGDSFTFGTGVEQGERASDLLEVKLRKAGRDCEVYNFGMAGLDTHGAIEVLGRSVAAYRPDQVVLMLYLGNDITDDSRRGPAGSASPGREPAVPSSLRTRALRWIRAHSQLYQFVVVRIASFPALAAVYNRLKAANLVGEAADQLEIMSIANAENARLWNPTREALRAFLDLAAAYGMRPLVVLLPARLQYDDSVWTVLVKARGLDRAAYSRDQPNRILGDYVVRELDAEFFDPLPGFRATGADAGSTYYPINGHFTSKGNELLADLMAQHLLSRVDPAGTSSTGSMGP